MRNTLRTFLRCDPCIIYEKENFVLIAFQINYCGVVFEELEDKKNGI